MHKKFEIRKDTYSVDVLIMASSRPDLLKRTVDAFQKNVVCNNTKLRWLIHEDFVYPQESKKVVEMVSQWVNPKFDVIEYSLPKIGVGMAMDKMFTEHVKSDFLFYMQDDWEFERPIDLDRIVWTMKYHDKINCVTFNKRVNNANLASRGFARVLRDYFDAEDSDPEPDFDFDGLKLFIYPGWQFLPGVWRMSKIQEKWQPKKVRPEGHWQKRFGDNDKRTTDVQHLIDNVGAYFYGPFNDYRYVRHLGFTWRMADWQLKENNFKPNGCRDWDFKNWTRDRAPWLGKLTPVPLNRSVPLTKEGKEMLKEQPEYIQEMFEQ